MILVGQWHAYLLLLVVRQGNPFQQTLASCSAQGRVGSQGSYRITFRWERPRTPNVWGAQVALRCARTQSAWGRTSYFTAARESTAKVRFFRRASHPRHGWPSSKSVVAKSASLAPCRNPGFCGLNVQGFVHPQFATLQKRKRNNTADCKPSSTLRSQMAPMPFWWLKTASPLFRKHIQASRTTFYPGMSQTANCSTCCVPSRQSSNRCNYPRWHVRSVDPQCAPKLCKGPLRQRNMDVRANS